MTDPPEPRQPGDDEEMTPEEVAEMRELQDFFDSEYFAEMGDDILIDNIAAGEDHRTIYDDLSDAEWELQDHLADIKEQTEDTPVPKLVSTDEAMKIIAEAKKKKEEDAAQRRAQSEVEGKMAIADDAQQVMQIANDATASQAMEQAIRALADAVGALNNASSHLSTVGENMQAAEGAIASQASQAAGLLGGETGGNIGSQGQAISQTISDELSRIANIDIAGTLQNVQGVDLAELSGRIQQLREAIKAAAQRHGG